MAGLTDRYLADACTLVIFYAAGPMSRTVQQVMRDSDVAISAIRVWEITGGVWQIRAAPGPRGGVKPPLIGKPARYTNPLTPVCKITISTKRSAGSERMTDNDALERAAREDLKHRPMFLLSYSSFDGPNPAGTDCRFLSLGWAQYDQRAASLKILRHTGDRWSRQSEEIPLHRAIDGVIFLSEAIMALQKGSEGNHLHNLQIRAGTFVNQNEDVRIQSGIESPDAFARELTTPAVIGQLATLRRNLNELQEKGWID